MLIEDFSLLMDYYELSMAYTFFKEKKHEDIVYFDLFIRKHPNQNGYVIFNGLKTLIEIVQNFKFSQKQIDYLRTKNFDEEFLNYLQNLKLTLDIDSFIDGSVAFKNEPFITVKGPIIQCQLLETLFLLAVNYSSLIATKAARINYAAKNKAVLEFGARRAHGMLAAYEGAISAMIGGCLATSNTLVGYHHNINISGTMAHSFIQMYDNEYEAFLDYAKNNPDNIILLVDTYNTLNSGVKNAIKLYNEYLKPNNLKLKAIRLDSGDLAYLSKKARKMLDEAGLTDTLIIVSNSLDETIIEDLYNQNAAIDMFGVGENLITAASNPVIGGVYKLVAKEINNTIVPVIKLSNNIEKITNPGYKKVYRLYNKTDNKAIADYIALAEELITEEPFEIFDPIAPYKTKLVTNFYVRELQVPIFRNGKLVYKIPSLEETIAYSKQERDSLWDEVKRLHNPHNYYVDLSKKLYDTKIQLIKKHQIKGVK